MPHRLIDLIGNTPLLEIEHRNSSRVRIGAKLEYFNPGGSVKDRPVKRMLLAAMESGALQGRTIIDATSGNTGIAYAMLCAEFRLPLELAMPENASEERKLILNLYGAKMHLTSPMEGTDGAQRFVQDLVQKQGDRYFYPDQYNNDNNWKAHLETTGPEIWEQSDGQVTHFLAGLGTSGTFVGTARYLQPKGVKCLSVQPDNPLHGLEGWKHMETAIVPGIYDAGLADDVLEVDTEDAFRYSIAAAKYLGLLISPSSAANLFAAIRLAGTLESGYIVTVFPDNAFKYLKDRFWSEHDYHIADPFH
ncbi:MAG: cysteine synthase family protein [Spirochaetales bacterium]|nr:cysteine synthase family protein [Leptospiraceae bacterium]MCP5483124.1 cysteine synthase family protein [Spirochaetales bacterium]MCP5484564.1 cysteine synthase family protein [Spirochaetales bacterium]